MQLHYYHKPTNAGGNAFGEAGPTAWLRGENRREPRPAEQAGVRLYTHSEFVARDTARAMSATAVRLQRQVRKALPDMRFSGGGAQGFALENKPHLGYFCLGRLPAVIDGEQATLAVFGANFTSYEPPHFDGGRLVFRRIPASADNDQAKPSPMFFGVAVDRHGNVLDDLGHRGTVFQHSDLLKTISTCSRLAAPQKRPAQSLRARNFRRTRATGPEAPVLSYG